MAEMATIDQSDIRGSEPHNLDPSGAASDCYRESGRACRIGQTRILLRACSGCCWLCPRVVGCYSSVGCFWFFILGKVLAFAFPQAVTRCAAFVSALVPMAQIKPNSSRPTAVTIFLLSFPLAANLAYRLCSRCCAFHAISFASSEAVCCRLRNPAQMAGGRS